MRIAPLLIADSPRFEAHVFRVRRNTFRVHCSARALNRKSYNSGEPGISPDPGRENSTDQLTVDLRID